MNPFDLRGPELLALYAAVLAGGFALSFLLRRRARGPHQALDTAQLALDPYQVAYLASGAHGVGLAALASLIDQGFLAYDAEEGALRRLRLEDEAAHPLERQVLRGVTDTSSDYSVSEVQALAVEAANRLVVERLRERGLVLTGEARRALRIWPASVMGLVAAFGGAKAAIGVARDEPVLSIVLLTIIPAVAAWAFASARAFRTGRGDNLHAELRRRNLVFCATATPAESVPALSGGSLVTAVGLFGAGALLPPQLSGFLKELAPPRASGGDGWSGGESWGSVDW